MKQYVSLFRIRFLYGLQYRAAALGGLATQFAWGFMLILAYRAFYRSNPAAFPMELSQTVSYIWMQQAFLMLFFPYANPSALSDAIESGAVAYDLVRPMDLLGRWFAEISADRLSKTVLRCAPVLVVALLLPEPFRLSLPESPGVLLLFLLSAALGLGVVTAFVILVYITVFHTLNLRGIRAATGALADFLCGAILPLPFFPASVRRVVELLPFAAMQNVPLRVYSGSLAGAEAARATLLQVFWLFALLLLGRLAMKQALGKVVVQGG